MSERHSKPPADPSDHSREHATDKTFQSENDYGAIFHSIADPMLLWEADSGLILDANSSALELFGFTFEELRVRNLSDLLASDSLKSIHKLKGLEVGASMILELALQRKNFDSVWVEAGVSCLECSGVKKQVAGIREITEQKRAERIQKETERLLKFTLFTVHQARIAVFWANAEGFFFYVNDMACQWLQYSRDELMKMHVADINPEFPREAWNSHWNDIKKYGMVELESFHRRKNGEVYPVMIYSNYVEFEGKEFKLAFVHDISEQKKTEEEKILLEERLRHAQKMEAIGALAGGVAHDFNNLLSPILGYSQLLQSKLEENEGALAQLEEIYKAGTRARNLTKQLLSFGRKQALEVKVLNVNHILENLEKMLAHTIREDVIIQKQLDCSHPIVEGDEGQLEQAFLNLMVNAQDAMPNGGHLTIETKEADYLDDSFPKFPMEGESLGPYVMVALSDTGHGIKKEILPHIFEPFFTTKEKGKGTGLGLSTSYGIVKQHNGYIWAYSELDKGTTFKIYLPRSENKAGEEGLPVKTLKPGKGKETVLIVEDQKEVRMLAKQILENFGYTVLEAPDGHSGLNLANAYKGDIEMLLTDVVMPKMNGKELYQNLIKTRPHLKALYTSGYTDNVIVHHGVMDKDVEFIPKPFGVKELAAKVRKILDKN